MSLLGETINRALRTASFGEASPMSMVLVGFGNRVAWCDLLSPDVKEKLDAGRRKVGQASEPGRPQDVFPAYPAWKNLPADFLNTLASKFDSTGQAADFIRLCERNGFPNETGTCQRV
jgi:hypothetical protein